MSALGSDAVRIETSAPSADIVVVRYLGAPAQRLLVVNLGDNSHSPMNDPLLAPAAARQWQELWSSELPQYGGSRVVPFHDAGAWLITGRSATLLGDSA